MNKIFHRAAVGLLLGACNLQFAQAQGTAFTYQGQLLNNGSPANGNFDFKLQLYAASTGGGLVAGPVTNPAVAVSNGLFTTLVDFGPGAFVGGSNWLHLAVQPNGGNNFVSLSPRQLFTPTPYALFAASASNLSGTLPASQLPAGVVTNNGSGVDLTGSFFGDGAGLKNVDADTLAGLAPANVWQLGGNNVAGGQFIGSTNNQPVEIWAAGQRAIRLEPDTSGSGSPNVIGGSIGNFMNAGGVIGGFIGGGGATNYNGVAYPNHVAAYYGSVVGGYANTIVAFANTAFIGGGDENIIAGNSAVIGGGENNRIKSTADHAVIGGGLANTNSGELGVIGGGQDNTATATGATVGGGAGSTVSGQYSTVAGGNYNSASGFAAAVGGGSFSAASGADATVGGGAVNYANGDYSTTGGGANNAASANSATVGGGAYNSASGTNATVAGGYNNTADNSWGTVSGGYQNNAAGWASTVGGGYQDVANNLYVTIAGGYQNYAAGGDSTISGGYQNTNSGDASTIGGGYQNSATGEGSTAGGGENNSASYYYDTVGGGLENAASGLSATVPGGFENVAAGYWSFAAGQQAQALYDGDFVWADSQDTPLFSTGPDQFIIRAQGGVGINFVNPTGDSLSVGGTTRLNNNLLYFRAAPDPNHGVGYYGNGTSFGGVSPDGPVLFGYSGGALGTRQNGAEHVAVQWTTTSVTVNGTFNNNSDRNAKQDFASVSAAQILAKVAQLPITTWRYKADAATPHLGPMAQDFYSAFHVGTDDQHIAPLDEGGVALAAIQGLHQKLNEKDARIQKQAGEIAELRQSVAELKKIVQALAARQ